MCISREDLDSRVKGIREYKSIKKDAENNLKPLENDVKEYMHETNQTELVGYGFSISYKEQEKETVVKDKVLELENICRCWFSAVMDYAPLYRECCFHVLAGDGGKQPKEGCRMPGVKKLFQESENSAKPEYIHGHMFGGLGILAGSTRNLACIPLSIRIHDGLQAALAFGDCLLLLDRCFLTVLALERLKTLNSSGAARMEIITKTKKSCTAYEKPGSRKPGRGRPPKKGAAVMHYLRKYFFRLLGKQPELRITQIIQEQQDESGTYWGSWAAQTFYSREVLKTR